MRFVEVPIITQMPSTVAPGETVIQTIQLRFQVEGVTDLVVAPMPSSPEQSLMWYNGREFHVGMSVEALTEVFGSGC